MENKIIYVAHPYTSDPEGNTAKVTDFLTKIQNMYPGKTFISPLHTFAFHEGEIEYWTTIRHCLSLLGHCDGALFPMNYMESQGCQLEREYCENSGIHFDVISYDNITSLGGHDGENR